MDQRKLILRFKSGGYGDMPPIAYEIILVAPGIVPTPVGTNP
jgi:hypothetical protein